MKTIFIDGGARVGESLELYVQQQPKLLGCDIHLFECNPTHQTTLQKISNNTDYNIFIHETALWNQSGTQEFYFSIDQWGDLGCTLDKNKREKLDLESPILVQTIRLSEFLSEFNEDDYIIVKLDIEGAEWEVVNDLIESNKILMINELYVEWHDVFFDKDFGSLRNKLSEYTHMIYDEWKY
jgi:FkbM family methyltransferase